MNTVGAEEYGPTIVGLSAFQHDSAAAVIHKGKVVAFAEEERFNRQKHTGGFPDRALAWGLHRAGISAQEVDIFAFYMDPAIIRRQLALEIPLLVMKCKTEELRQRILATAALYRQIQQMRQRLPARAKIVFLPHHFCHAAYAYYLSGQREATVVTVDSIGEHVTTGAFEAKENRIVLRDSIRGIDSLGYIYGAVTEHLGFRRGDGEGTVMALAATAVADKEDIEQILSVDGRGRYHINREYFLRRFSDPRGPRVSSRFIDHFGPRRASSDPLKKHHAQLAAATQVAVETALLAYVERAVQAVGCPNVCLAGGVALNSVANRKIRELRCVQNLFIGPAANDAGCALGAALLAYVNETGAKPDVVPSRRWLELKVA